MWPADRSLPSPAVWCSFFYNFDQYPNQRQRAILAARTGLSNSSVQTWFQNRRAKEKRESESKKQENRARYCNNQPFVNQGNFIFLCKKL